MGRWLRSESGRSIGLQVWVGCCLAGGFGVFGHRSDLDRSLGSWVGALRLGRVFESRLVMGVGECVGGRVMPLAEELAACVLVCRVIPMLRLSWCATLVACVCRRWAGSLLCPVSPTLVLEELGALCTAGCGYAVCGAP